MPLLLSSGSTYNCLLGTLQSTSSSMDICNQDTTVPPDNTSCADCIAAATDAAVSVAKFAGVACQQAAFCLVATCVSLFEPSATQLESEHVYTSSSPDSSSGILQGLYAPPLPLTMAEPPCTLWKGFAGSRPSAFVGQLTVTVWTNDFFQQPDRTMQVFFSIQIVAFDLTGRGQTAPALIHLLLLPTSPRVKLDSYLLQHYTEGLLLVHQQPAQQPF